MSDIGETAPSETIAAALEAQSIELGADVVPKLDRYCRLLWDWNQRLNLTRHLDYDTFVARDLVDTMQLSKLIGTGEQILDVGSGGGVPGVTIGQVCISEMRAAGFIVISAKQLNSSCPDLGV